VILIPRRTAQHDIASERALYGHPAAGEIVQELRVVGDVGAMTNPPQTGHAKRRGDTGRGELTHVDGEA